MDRDARDVATPPRGAGAAHVRTTGRVPDVPQPRRWAPGVAGLVQRLRGVLAWWQGTRAARANARFGEAGGGLLTGGLAYTALFSVFAGLTIGYTAFMAVLGGNPDLRATVLRTVGRSLPGLIDTGDGTGLLEPDQLVLSTGLSVAGVVAFMVLLLTATRLTAALRTAVRAMFGVHDADSLVAGKLRELGGFVGIAVAVLVSAVLGIAATAAVGWVLDALGWPTATRLAARGVGVLVALVVDAAVFVLLVRVLAGQAPPRRDLLGGALIAAVGVGTVRLLGTSVVAGSVERDPVLASFAVVVVLLLWINLIARIVLLAAAWTADPHPDGPTVT